MLDGWRWLVVGVRQRRVVVKKEELSALVYQALERYLMQILPAAHQCYASVWAGRCASRGRLHPT